MGESDSGSSDVDSAVQNSAGRVASRAVDRLLEPVAAVVEGPWLWAASIGVIVVVGVAARAIGGWNAFRTPWPYAAAAAIEALVAVVARRRAHLQPKILMARFVSPGGNQAAADDLRRRVSRAIKDRTVAVPLGRIRVEMSERTVDADDDSACDRFRQNAADRGFVAAIAASIDGDPQNLSGRWVVLPAPQRAQAIGAMEKTVNLEPANVPFEDVPTAIARAAEIITGVVLLQCGKGTDALTVLRNLQPTYVSLLFAAYTAWRLKRWDDATTLALQALQLDFRPAAAAIAFSALMEQDLINEATKVLSLLENPAREEDIGLSLRDLDILTFYTRIEALKLSLDRHNRDIWSQLETAKVAIEAQAEWRREVDAMLEDGDGPGAVALIERHPDRIESSDDRTTYAQALIAAGRVDDGIVQIRAVSKALRDDPPDGGDFANSVVLGDDWRVTYGQHVWSRLIGIAARLENDEVTAELVAASLALLGQDGARQAILVAPLTGPRAAEYRNLRRPYESLPKTMALIDTANQPPME